MLGNAVLFVLFFVGLLGLSMRMEFEGICMWWLVAYLAPLTALVMLRPDLGFGHLRLGLLRDVACPLLAIFLLIAWQATDFRAELRIAGEVRRLAAAYTEDPMRARSLLADANEEVLRSASGHVPAWVIAEEQERRRAERLHHQAAERRRIAEQRQKEAEFAETPLGRALGLIFVIGWLLSELIA